MIIVFHLISKILTLCKDENVDAFFPSLEYCTDNGAMIALAGYIRIKKGFQDKDKSIDIKPRWPIEEIEAIK